MEEKQCSPALTESIQQTRNNGMSWGEIAFLIDSNPDVIRRRYYNARVQRDGIEAVRKEISSFYSKQAFFELDDLEQEYYRDKFGIQEYRRKDGVYTADRFTLSFKADKYLNGTFKVNALPSLPALKVFADVIQRYEEKVHGEHCYKYRLTQGLFIALARDFHSEMDATYLFEMLKLADSLPHEMKRKTAGFRAWLLTSSYCGNKEGNIGRWEWSHKQEFRRLIDAGK